MFIIPRLSILSFIPVPSYIFDIAYLCLYILMLLYVCFDIFSYWYMYLFFYYKSQSRTFSSIELENLYSIISTLPIISSVSSNISKVIALRGSIEHKNLILRLLAWL